MWLNEPEGETRDSVRCIVQLTLGGLSVVISISLYDIDSTSDREIYQEQKSNIWTPPFYTF